MGVDYRTLKDITDNAMIKYVYHYTWALRLPSYPDNQINVHFRSQYPTSLEFREGGVGQLSITQLLYEILQELYCIETCGPSGSV